MFRTGLALLTVCLAVPCIAIGDDAQRAAHLLDYIAVDYRDAVRDGLVINQLEYDEQLEFLTRVAELLGGLEGDPSNGGLARLETAVRSRAPAERVAVEARALSAAIYSHYQVRVPLAQAPQPAAAAQRFAEQCASCHGARGRGDGPAGVGLDPPPSDLGDPVRMLSLSPATIFSTISYGIDGTGMVGYADRLSERERIDLTFFTATLAHTPADVARGRELVERDPRRAAGVAASLDKLFSLVPAELPGDPDDRAILAYLRSAPASLVGRELPLEIARARLAESLAAHRAGDADAAMRMAVSAYLDGFEHIEPALALADPALGGETEAELMAYRSALRDGGDPSAVDAAHERIVSLFDRAEAALSREGLSANAAFFASFAILVREGIEAILLVAAILAIVSRAPGLAAGRGRVAVHLGWVSALLAGGLTWWAARNLVAVSGAQREVVEGVSSLLAAGVLIWVSYWLFSRIDVQAWQAFLNARLEAAAARGSLWVLGGLAFLAVYREAFETVLFYQALAAQGAGSHLPALVAGAATAAGLLLVVGFLIMGLGRRLPLRQFFATSSVVLYAFAVIFAGQGIAAFQEAGALSLTAVNGPRVPWLGVYPSLEGLGAQGALVALGLAAVPLAKALRGAATAPQQR